MFSVSIDTPKGPSYYPQNMTFQFYICYHKKCYLNATYLKNYDT